MHFRFLTQSMVLGITEFLGLLVFPPRETGMPIATCLWRVLRELRARNALYKVYCSCHCAGVVDWVTRDKLALAACPSANATEMLLIFIASAGGYLVSATVTKYRTPAP